MMAPMKRSKLEMLDESSVREAKVIDNLNDGSQYKFLEVLENLTHENSLFFSECRENVLEKIISDMVEPVIRLQ